MVRNGPPPDPGTMQLGTFGLHSLVSKTGFPVCFLYRKEGCALVLVRFQGSKIESVCVNPYSASSLCEHSGFVVGLTTIDGEGRPVKFLSSKIHVIDSKLIRLGFFREVITDEEFVNYANCYVDNIARAPVVHSVAAGVPEISIAKAAKPVATLPPEPVVKVVHFEPGQASVSPSAGSNKRGKFEL